MDNCEKDNLSHFIKTTAEFFNLGKNISPCFSGMRLYGENNRCIKPANGKAVLLVSSKIYFVRI